MLVQAIDLTELEIVEESTVQSASPTGGFFCGVGCDGLICGLWCGLWSLVWAIAALTSAGVPPMRNSKMSSIRVTVGVIFSLAILSLGGCAPRFTLPDTPWQLSLQGSAKVLLFPGDQSYQDGDSLLLMSSYTLEHPPTQIMAFSLSEREEKWRVDLPAPPVQAVRFGTSYLVATIPSESSGEAYVIALDTETGEQQWARAWGKTMIALASDPEQVWIAWEQGVASIDPTTGEARCTVANWEHPTRYGSQRALAVQRGKEETFIAAAAGRMVFFYQGHGREWKLLGNFQSAGRVLEIHALEGEAEPIWLLLAHSYGYSIGPDGQILWRVNNSDYNLDGQPVRCEDQDLWAFRNVMGKLYLVTPEAIVRSWQLPGGPAHIGPIPLPFPEHLAFGLQVSDLNGDREDELIVRSIQHLFVFDCRADLKAWAPVGIPEGKLVQQLRHSRLHRPGVAGGVIVTPGEEGILYFEVHD